MKEINAEMPSIASSGVFSNGLRRVTKLCVLLAERVMPDPFVIAIMLTLLTCALAMAVAPKSSPSDILTSWYDGVFKIAAFAFMIALTLVSGHALATSKPVSGLLRRIAAIPRSATGAMVLTFLVSLIAGLMNWAVGLVVSAIFAREIAKRVEADFAWLVAAAYAGWTFYVCGISSSIAVLSAMSGSPLNVIEKVTGHVLPMPQFLLSPLNLVPVFALAVILPLVLHFVKPRCGEVIAADSKKLMAEDEVRPEAEGPRTLASRLDNAWILNVAIVMLGCGYFGIKLVEHKLTLDLNTLVIAFLLAGMAMHWTPKSYLKAINNASRIAGPVLLQFPFYGGIMGIMSATGLADVLAGVFIKFSSATTLPFWTFVSSTIISLFVPSAGGHWIVQAPFVVPAAQHLGVSQSSVAIAVALGEGVANMIQPMWVIPLLAIAGVGMGRVMGFTLIIFTVMFAVMGGTLLILH